MKRLILVRHGVYVGSALTDLGRQQMQELASVLAKSIVGNMLLVSSPIQRAKESATILAEHFRVPVYEHKAWEADGEWGDHDAAFQFIAGIDASVDTLVVVTHLPFLQSFPAYYGKNALDVALPYAGVEKGQAQVIDCEMRTMTCVTPVPNDTGNASLPVRAAPPISRVNGSCTGEQAKRYVTRLKQAAPHDRLKKVYLFGSVAKHGSGNDIDLVFEVPCTVFLEFVSACVGALDGFHPVTLELSPWASAYWDYESPKEARAKYALNAIAVSPDVIAGLTEIVPHEKVDILCLPTGWRGEADVGQILHEAFGFCKDPKLLHHIIDSAIELH